MAEAETTAQQGSDEKQAAPVVILSDIATKINFAAHQSSFAFLRSLRIISNSAEIDLENIKLRLTATPAFLKEKVWRADRIAPGRSIEISDRDIEMDGGFLLGLAEAMRGTITLTASRGEEVLAEESRPVELLAYNEWGGAGYMPELLATFSMPNEPAIDRVLHDASMILRKAGKRDGIDGYQSNSRQRAWELASAIYSAICNLGLSYALPPTSFERDGQKIRLPSQILEGRVATCLDLAMLFSSALEQAGLNPIVVLVKEHAAIGVWLQPEGLATILIDEAEILRKRIQLNELVVFETTFATSHPAPPFSKAVTAANAHITPEKDASFVAAVDIRRARAHRITPLGLKRNTTERQGGEEGAATLEQPFEEAPALPDFDAGVEEDEKPETPSGRLDRWQRKLLDLSARNPLLNHRSSRASLRLICPDPGGLEDALSRGQRFALQSVPKPTAAAQDQALHQQRTGEVITEEYARDALAKGQVLVDLATDELNARAIEIYRKAQTALQEGGSNTLYVAIGFLIWKQDEKSDRRFRAPLILFPVSLERKSVRSGVRMVAHDDEPRFNTTLLEMLRKDFRVDIKGLDGQLPADVTGDGVDVAGIWQRVRVAIKEVPGFEVVEEVVLGHFSFAKYLMWKDLVDRTEVLRLNPVVKHLLDTPREPYGSQLAFVDGADIDRKYHPSDLLTPLPADASQMAAIATADKGKDFIVIGPPGTGKSQTISNLIAHLLSKDKTVLFVSEKTAALEVVHRRLRQVGLGRFCLELHSNKANKADVLRQLRDAWSVAGSREAESWQSEAERLKVLRDELNLVVDCLHARRRNGLTAHHAIGIKVRDAVLASRVALHWPSADYHDELALRRLREMAERLRIQAAAVGDVAKSPFQPVGHDNWSPQWESALVDAAARLSAAIDVLTRAVTALQAAVRFPVRGRTSADLEAAAELASVLLECWRRPAGFAVTPEGASQLDSLDRAITALKAYDQAREGLSCTYAPLAWRQLDGDVIAAAWQRAGATWWPRRFFLQRRVIGELVAGGAAGKPDVNRDAPLLKALRVEGEKIDALAPALAEFGEWKAHDSDPSVLSKLHDLGQRVAACAGRLAGDPASLTEIRTALRTLLQEGNELLAPDALTGRAAADYQAAYFDFAAALDAFSVAAASPIRERVAAAPDLMPALRDIAETIRRRHAELKTWCHWQRCRTEAGELGLQPLVVAIEAGAVPSEEIEETFFAAYCTWWSTALIGEDVVLRNFSSAQHFNTLAKFRDLDTRFQQLTAEHIAAKLSGRLPGDAEQKSSASWGVLRQELAKKMRHKPVRQLVQEAPDALTALTPCLMMSPLSVAQYLPAGHAQFDVVIFDEASQITVWDAVGALARGRQVIVAGDPKQMPPTNFFARSDDDPDGDIDVDGDLESILDEMLGSGIPQRTLNLHYRSRRESLIAFSNSRYYDNSLITFPAPVHPDHGIKLVRPVGFYARGGARHNEGEAKAVVAEIVRRLTHPDDSVRKASIGVVTFNSEQMSLIENLLDEARDARPEIEPFFSEESTPEPVFVKNLETVQGDERDIILFSITYGPDQSNHVTMNFGPLNRSGGERRLNVALTRARSEMMIFSTLDPNRIDLSRSSARAVADLKHFLEYAERGPAALGAAVRGSVGDFESPFEVAVARALRGKGWIVHTQIGVSAYRIDLGVVHPDLPGLYLAGVECDGAMYHSSAFARERDKIRQSVLEGLGWTLFRIWSTDWWTNAGGALDTLHSALEVHLQAMRQEKVSPSEAVPEPTSEQSAPQVVRFASRPDTDSSSGVYVLADLGAFPADAAAFYDAAYQKRLSAMIDHVIDTEGPIHEELLLRRIARHHGFQRIGSRIRETVLDLAQRRRGRTTEPEIEGRFFWKRGTVRDRVVPARHTRRDEELADPDFVCREELKAIQQTLSLGGDPTEFSRRLGFGRLSPSSRTRLERILSG